MEDKQYIKKLDGLHKSYSINNERFILLFKICKDISKKKNLLIESLILRVYNGSQMWMQEINKFVIDQLRNRSGVEGPDSTLCDMIHHAIVAQEFSIQINDRSLQINLQFLLGKGVHVKGTLDLGDAVPVVNDEDYKLINKMFIYDLYDALQQHQHQQPQKEDSSNKKDPQPSVPINNYIIESSNQASKAKPNSDMVRPTMRKRRGIGAKLG